MLVLLTMPGPAYRPYTRAYALTVRPVRDVKKVCRDVYLFTLNLHLLLSAACLLSVRDLPVKGPVLSQRNRVDSTCSP